MFVGDTYPPALLQIQDETGVLNLSAAFSITVKWEGATHHFSGPGTPIWPATADPDGVHFWNLSYVFASGDTSLVDNYTPYAVVTWTAGNVETFPTTDVLTVKAALL